MPLLGTLSIGMIRSTAGFLTSPQGSDHWGHRGLLGTAKYQIDSDINYTQRDVTTCDKQKDVKKLLGINQHVI